MTTAITPELLDQLLANYEKPEDLTGDNGLFKQLKKALIERALGALLTAAVNQGAGTNFFVEPSERATSISTSSGEGAGGGVTWVKLMAVQMVPSGCTTVIEVEYCNIVTNNRQIVS